MKSKEIVYYGDTLDRLLSLTYDFIGWSNDEKS